MQNFPSGQKICLDANINKSLMNCFQIKNIKHQKNILSGKPDLQLFLMKNLKIQIPCLKYSGHPITENSISPVVSSHRTIKCTGTLGSVFHIFSFQVNELVSAACHLVLILRPLSNFRANMILLVRVILTSSQYLQKQLRVPLLFDPRK